MFQPGKEAGNFVFAPTFGRAKKIIKYYFVKS